MNRKGSNSFRRVMTGAAAIVAVAAVFTACGCNLASSPQSEDSIARSERTTSTPNPSTRAPTTGATAPLIETTTSEPDTTTSTIVLEPPEIVLPGFEGTVARTVAIVFTAAYPEFEGQITYTPQESLAEFLQGMGLVVRDAPEDAEAVITFDLGGEVLSALYGAGNSRRYAGAAYTGTIRFEIEGVDTKEWEVSVRREPPDSIPGIGQQYREPADAPFGALLGPSILKALADIWGPERTMQALVRGTSWTNEIVFYEEGREWLTSVASKVLPILMELRLSDEPAGDQVGARWAPSEWACRALGQIVAYEAVPAADRATIVRALISDLAGPDRGASGALFYLAQTVALDTGETRDSREISEWSAEQWAEWAGAHGY